MKVNCIIGIDPGKNGGIAIYRYGYKVTTIKMPKDLNELKDMFRYYSENFTTIIFLEKLSIRPDDIKVENNGKANMGKIFRVQTMMANYERLKVLIELSGIPYAMVHPMTWQSKLGLRKHGVKEEKAKRKHRYRRSAIELYPGQKVTLWNADALLIMHFGRWALENDINWVRGNVPTKEQGKIFD